MLLSRPVVLYARLPGSAFDRFMLVYAPSHLLPRWCESHDPLPFFYMEGKRGVTVHDSYYRLPGVSTGDKCT
jgi:hypothetical protein